MANLTREQAHSHDANRDPISGEPGAHPVGTGLGAAVGGAAAGAAGGTMAGPIGTAVGAVVGAVAGGLAGKGIAESIDPTAEDAYWRENYASRPYHDPSLSYDDVRPAYEYGWGSRSKYEGSTFDEVENDLRHGWESTKDHARQSWDKARHAARDAWERVDSSSGRNRSDDF